MTPSRRVMLSAFTTALAGVVQAQAPSMDAPSSWVGSWTAGLRPAPDAEPFSARQMSQDRLAGMTLSTTRGSLLISEATRDVAQ